MYYTCLEVCVLAENRANTILCSGDSDEGQCMAEKSNFCVEVSEEEGQMGKAQFGVHFS
jgi:hypothetical protein